MADVRLVSIAMPALEATGAAINFLFNARSEAVGRGGDYGCDYKCVDVGIRALRADDVPKLR